ncbi:four helix bundle protein [Treponema sp.]|uniref:four helix bundle protein n=1 Tax=Treponema sp. TaxID=166 RepID=UPI00298E2315|nr:four helix bundle protein [Treponema sp.]MCQ2240301.1 four helix bundle protein [Treponema sp.]
MKDNNIVVIKSRDFAIKIIRLYQFLISEKKEYVLSKQILRSGTSIGANVKEAIRGQSKADFYAKLGISLKESSETEYWLDLLHETKFINDELFQVMFSDNIELTKILTAILKTRRKCS